MGSVKEFFLFVFVLRIENKVDRAKDDEQLIQSERTTTNALFVISVREGFCSLESLKEFFLFVPGFFENETKSIVPKTTSN